MYIFHFPYSLYGIIPLFGYLKYLAMTFGCPGYTFLGSPVTFFLPSSSFSIHFFRLYLFDFHLSSLLFSPLLLSPFCRRFNGKCEEGSKKANDTRRYERHEKSSGIITDKSASDMAGKSTGFKGMGYLSTFLFMFISFGCDYIIPYPIGKSQIFFIVKFTTLIAN